MKKTVLSLSLLLVFSAHQSFAWSVAELLRLKSAAPVVSESVAPAVVEPAAPVVVEQTPVPVKQSCCQKCVNWCSSKVGSVNASLSSWISAYPKTSVVVAVATTVVVMNILEAVEDEEALF